MSNRRIKQRIERRNLIAAKAIHDDRRPVYRGKVLANVYWATAGSGLYALSQWAMIALLARSTDPATLGIHSLALAVTGPVFVFFNMQLRTFLATDVERRYHQVTYLLARLGTTIAALTVSGILCLANAYSHAFAMVVAVVALAKAIESFSDLCYGEFQLNQRLDLVARSQILRAVLSLIAFTTTLLATQELLPSLCAMAVAWLIVLLTHDIKKISRDTDFHAYTIRSRSDFGQIAKLVRKCLPLAPAGLFVALEINVPRYFLVETHDLGQLGLYSALSHVALALQILAASVFHALVPKLASQGNAGDTEGANKLVRTSCCIGAAAGAVAILAAYMLGDIAISLIYGSEYAGHRSTFVLLIASTAFTFVWLPLAANVQAMQNLWTRFWLHLVSLLVICFSSWQLIPDHGIEGAAGALFCGSITQVFGYFIGHRLSARRTTNVTGTLDID